MVVHQTEVVEDGRMNSPGVGSISENKTYNHGNLGIYYEDHGLINV